MRPALSRLSRRFAVLVIVMLLSGRDLVLELQWKWGLQVTGS